MINATGALNWSQKGYLFFRRPVNQLGPGSGPNIYVHDRFSLEVENQIQRVEKLCVSININAMKCEITPRHTMSAQSFHPYLFYFSTHHRSSLLTIHCHSLNFVSNATDIMWPEAAHGRVERISWHFTPYQALLVTDKNDSGFVCITNWCCFITMMTLWYQKYWSRLFYHHLR